MRNPGASTNDGLAALLQEAGEAMRFDGERLWRSEEFYAGAIVASLGAAAAAFGLSPTVSVVSAILALIGVFLATMGLVVLNLEAYHFVRDRQVWRRLLLLQAGVIRPARSLELEVRMLTASIEDLEKTAAADLIELSKSDLLPKPESIGPAGGVRHAFQQILFLLGLIAAAATSLLLFFTYEREGLTLYTLATWAFISVAALVVVLAGRIPRRDLARRLQNINKKVRVTVPAGVSEATQRP